jgi:CDP-diglyceride synthetase
MRDVLPKKDFYFSFIAWLPAIFGDLFESKIKRALGIKDSGEVLLNSKFTPFRILELPLASHGGYLDRIDSFSFTVLGYAIFARFMP